MTAFPDLQVFMDNLTFGSGSTTFHWTLTGTYSETGKPVRISGCEIWTMSADGLIAASIGKFDRADYLLQIQT